MIPLVLVAVTNLHTLAGVTLGSNVMQVLSEHPEAQRSAKESAHWWRWSRPAGGTVTVTADDAGTITTVDFHAVKSEGGSIDLPCVGSFPVQDSDVNLNVALNKTFQNVALGTLQHLMNS